jgi:hypothetical protein
VVDHDIADACSMSRVTSASTCSGLGDAEGFAGRSVENDLTFADLSNDRDCHGLPLSSRQRGKLFNALTSRCGTESDRSVSMPSRSIFSLLVEGTEFGYPATKEHVLHDEG